MKHVVSTLVGFLLLCSSYSIQGQAPGWSWKRSPLNSASSVITDLEKDRENNIYVSGGFYGDSLVLSPTVYAVGIPGNSNDGFIAKFDPLGNPLWLKTFGSNEQEQYEYITLDSAGNVYGTAAFYGDTFTVLNHSVANSWVTNSPDIATFKLDKDGNFKWLRKVDGNGSEFPYDIELDQYANVYLTTGYYNSTVNFAGTTVSNSSLTYYGGFVAKYDKDGNEVWMKGLSSQGNVYASEIYIDSSNTMYIGGSFDAASITFGNHTLTSSFTIPSESESYLFKLNSDGNVLWSKTFGSNTMGNEYVSEIKTDHVGNIILVGDFDGSTMTVDGSTVANVALSDAYLLKLNASGNLIWFKGYGGNGYDFFNDIEATQNDDLIVCGSFTGNTIGLGTNTLTNNNPGISRCDSYVFRIKADGSNISWVKSAHGNLYDGMLDCIALDPYDNAYTGGSFDSPFIYIDGDSLQGSGVVTQNEMLVCKLGNSNATTWVEGNLNVKIYPNPATDIFYVETEEACTLQVYDALGRVVCEREIQAGLNSIDLKESSAGIYQLLIQSLKEHSFSSQSLVVQP
jgi:hypothetical protein